MPFLHVTFNLRRIATYELGDEALSIGRALNNEIVIDNPGVSSSHARIFKEGGDYYIEDLGSMNGSYLGESKIERHRLDFGDVITIFKHQLHYVPLVGNDAPMAEATASGGIINQSATLVIDRSQIAELSGKEQQIELVVDGEHGTRTLQLDKHSYCIGKSDDCFIRTKGLMAPSVSARLMRQASGYLLVPERKHEVRVNGMEIEDAYRLCNGDSIEIRKVGILYRVDSEDGD